MVTALTRGQGLFRMRSMVGVICRFKYNTVHILDSGAAYFGSDNVGLCGIAWYFKVRAAFSATCLLASARQSCRVWMSGKAPVSFLQEHL